MKRLSIGSAMFSYYHPEKLVNRSYENWQGCINLMLISVNPLERVALKACSVMQYLLLQKPHAKSKTKELTC